MRCARAAKATEATAAASESGMRLGVVDCCAPVWGLKAALADLSRRRRAFARERGEGRHRCAREPLLFPPKPAALLPAPAHVTQLDLDRCMDEVARDQLPWLTGDFAFVKPLQEASRNFGCVHHMTTRRVPGAAPADGPAAREAGSEEEAVEVAVAVKKMPQRWVAASAQDFERHHPDALEKPWQDLACLRRLSELKYPYVCDLHGLFADNAHAYVVTSFVGHGDLFAWTFEAPGFGGEREAWLRPLFSQIFEAVRWLHDLGVAHRDLSLENVLLEQVPTPGTPPRVKVIDFAMATCSRPCSGLTGKRSYQPPEMHLAKAYDPFLSDNFALGVMLFVLATKDYPWASTRHEKCDLFRYVRSLGFAAYWANRKHQGSDKAMCEVFSEELFVVLNGLLKLNPSSRACLGEACLMADNSSDFARKSVWETQWLAGFSCQVLLPTQPASADPLPGAPAPPAAASTAACPPMCSGAGLATGDCHGSCGGRQRWARPAGLEEDFAQRS